MVHCIYAIFHLARPAGARPPASSSSYQIFASFADVAVIPLYTYGCLTVRNSGSHWGTLFQDQGLTGYFLPALYYALFAGAIVHLVTLGIGFWLAVKFRQITMLPPDMNPLEANLTSRHQKTMSVATTASYLTEDEKHLSMPYDDVVDRPPAVPFHATRSSPRNSIGSADFPPRQYQITPGNSPRGSPHASPRNSAYGAADFKRMSAPPGPSSSSPHANHAPSPPPRSPWRHSHSGSPFSEASTSDIADFRPPYGRVPLQAPPSPTKSMGATAPPSPRGSYGPPSPRAPGPQSCSGTANPARQQQPQRHSPMDNKNPANASSPPRPAKFTETWYATESLFNRTHERNRAMNAAATKKTTAGGRGRGYAAINRRDNDSDSESDYENDGKTASGGYRYHNLMSPDADEVDADDGDLGASKPHPNPLRSNPSLPSIARTNSSDGRPKSTPGPTTTTTTTQQGTRRPYTPFVRKSSALSEIDLNDGRVGGDPTTAHKQGAGDISDEKPYGNLLKPSRSRNKRYTWAPTTATPRNRDSSIQPEADFYAKPYGELKAATPPVMVGSDRQVSSGNDYAGRYLGGAAPHDGPVAAAKRNFSFGKRNVSGKVAEEGRGSIGWAW